MKPASIQSPHDVFSAEDYAYIRLISAILNQPEEVLLADLLARREK